MAQKSSFFDTTPDDPREYPAREFAEYFSRFIGNGIFGGGTTLKVEPAGGNLKVTVALGYGWINGYLYSVYDAPVTLTVDPATGANRIDRIVLRLDTSIQKRSVEVIVKKGSSPTVAPALTRSGDIYELSLAQILVQNGGSVIIGSQITDERLNTSLCGIVTGLITQADTTAIFNQFQSWYNNQTVAYQVQWNDWFNAIKVTLTAQWQTWMDGLTSATPVISVNGKGGTVTLDASDVGANPATDYVRQPGYAVTAGTGNAYTVSTTPAPTALVDGMGIVIRANRANTGASTLKWDTAAAVPIVDAKGNTLTAGKIPNGARITLRYSSAAGNFQLQGEGGEYGNATVADVLAPKTIGTDDGLVTGTMLSRTGHVAGQSITRSGTTLRIRPQAGHFPGDTGNSVQWDEPNWTAANIPLGMSMFGLAGSKAEGLKTVTGTASTNESLYFVFLKPDGTTTSIGHYYIQVAVNFGFVPKYILYYSGQSYYGVYDSRVANSQILYSGSRQHDQGYMSAVTYSFRLGGNSYVNETGFRLPADHAGFSFSYIAIG